MLKHLIIIIALLLTPVLSYSATITLSAVPSTLNVGDVVHVTIFVENGQFVAAPAQNFRITGFAFSAPAFANLKFSTFSDLQASLAYPLNTVVLDVSVPWIGFYSVFQNPDGTWSGNQLLYYVEPTTSIDSLGNTVELMQQTFDLANSGETLTAQLLSQTVSFFVGALTSIAFCMAISKTA